MPRLRLALDTGACGGGASTAMMAKMAKRSLLRREQENEPRTLPQREGPPTRPTKNTDQVLGHLGSEKKQKPRPSNPGTRRRIPCYFRAATFFGGRAGGQVTPRALRASRSWGRSGAARRSEGLLGWTKIGATGDGFDEEAEAQGRLTVIGTIFRPIPDLERKFRSKIPGDPHFGRLAPMDIQQKRPELNPRRFPNLCFLRRAQWLEVVLSRIANEGRRSARHFPGDEGLHPVGVPPKLSSCLS